MNDHLWTAQHLPWYVNGSLVGEDLERARRHLGECVLCRQDLREQEALREAVAAPSPAATHAAHALADLHQRIDAHERRSLRTLFAGTPAAARWVMGIQGMLLLVAVGWFVAQRPAPTLPAYRTLSQQALPAADLRVVFAPGMDAAARDAWLEQHGARLVRGPGSGGVVALDWPGEPDALLVERLRQDPRLLFVAPSAAAP